MTDPASTSLQAMTPLRRETGATIRLAWPLVAANLLQMLTYAIDVMFIARLGELPLAASALAVSFFGLIMWALSSLTGAVAAVIAAELGANPKAVRPVRRATRMALWLGLAAGVLGTVICLALEPLLRVTGQEPEVIALAATYMPVLALSMTPMILASVLRSYVSALDRPIYVTLIAGLGIFVNAAGNYAFIFGNWGAPALGLTGAAIATNITALVLLALYALVIRRDPLLAKYRIWTRCWVPDFERLWQIVRIGTPLGFTVMAEAGVFAAAAFIMGGFGAAQLAGHTLALQIAALAFMVPFGVGQAATIRVGYFFGARDPEGVGRAGLVALAIGVGFMVLTALSMLLVPRLLLSVYVDVDAPENATMLAFALKFLAFAALFQLADGMQAVAQGALRGLQDTRVPMWLAIFSYWGPGFGLAMVLGIGLGLEGTGVWIGLATGLFVAAALLLRRWLARKRLGLVERRATVSTQAG